MILAHVNTGHYDFVVVSETESQAKVALLKAVRDHANQLDPEHNWLDRTTLRNNVREWWEFTEIELDQVLRDGSTIKP